MRHSAWIVALILGLLVASGASAHVVMGTKSLHLRVAEAHAIVRGRVLQPAAMFVSEDRKTQRALIEIEVLETLKGRTDPGLLRIAQDGHAVATYQKGDVALFFLKPIARSRELRSLAQPGGATHVSSQEHDEEFVLGGPEGATLLSATRSFVASESAETTEERISLIRAATLDLLTSVDSRLANAALASLVLAPQAEWITSDDLPRLHSTLANPATSIGFKAGLIDELERRGLIAGEAERLSLLRSAQADSLPEAIRALGSRAGPRVNTFLIGLVAADSIAPDEVVAEAAIALGTSGDPRALDALGGALERPERRIQNAALRGLGLFGGAGAERILSQAATEHPDARTRRRALAEVQKIRSRQAQGAAAESSRR